MPEFESLRDMATRIACVIRERLTDDEFECLLRLGGDYTTETWLYQALLEAGRVPR